MLIPASTARALSRGRPIGNNSDLYPHWLAAREILLHHRDPYSAEVTREIQSGYYGRPLDNNRISDPRDRQAFTYPLYVAFLLAPTVTLPFSFVMKGFGWLLLFCTAASVTLWMRTLGLHPPDVVVLAIMLLAMSTYAVVQGFYKQQFTLLVAFFLAAAVLAVVKEHLVTGGFLLALSTIKPQLSGLLILWLLVWTLASWRKRKALAWGFVGTITALMIGAEFLHPGWVSEFAAAVQLYRRYAADEPIVQVLLTSGGGKVATVALILAFVFLCWKLRKSEPASLDFGLPIALAMAITLVILNKVAPYNQILLLPAVLWLAARWQANPKFLFGGRAAIIAILACLSWQWITATVLAIWSFFVPIRQLQLLQLPFYTLFALPPIVIIAVLLSLPASQPRDSAIPTD